MASISLADFRSLSGISAATMPNASAAVFLGAASAFVVRITGLVLGGVIESAVQVGAGVSVVCYRHGLGASGQVYIANTGTNLDGVRSFTRVDLDTIMVTGVALASAFTGTGVICPKFLKDFDIRDNRIRPIPTPVAAVEEMRVDEVFPSMTSASPFAAATIVDPTQYYIAADGGSITNTEIELNPNVQKYRGTRMRGFINPTYRRTRRIARLSYYCGCIDGIPMDLMSAISGLASDLSKDVSGSFQSESLDYYSYSRMSAEEMRKLPTSSISILSRYKVW